MKPRNSIVSAAVAAVVASVVATAAFAEDQYSENAGFVRLLELANGAAAGTTGTAAAGQPALDPALYSENGGALWLAQLANGSANVGKIAQSATVLPCGHLLKDGGTVHIFPDGKMGMEDRFGRPYSMDDGQPMQAADGSTIIMKGNEVWRTDELLFGNSRGS